MTIFFTPNGSLNINADPSDLPEEASGSNTSSGEMQRCKNMRLEESGVARTRDGIVKSMSDIGSPVRFIIEQAGDYYSGAGDSLYINETAIETGFSSARWSGISYNSYNASTNNIFILNGTNRRRLEYANSYAWGLSAPSAPTIELVAIAGLTGDYNAKISYVRKEGSTVVYESDMSSAASAAVTLANQSLKVSWTAPSDSQITHVRVYRTIAGGSDYYFDQDVAVGTEYANSTQADTLLGTTGYSNHDRPPQGSYVIGPNFNGVCFIIKDNLLYYCLAKQPEYWPTSYYIEVSPRAFPGKCGCFWNGNLYYLTSSDIYIIQGTGNNTFFPYKQNAITGTQGQLAVESVTGDGIYHVGLDGVYKFATTDIKITHGRFDRIFRGETVNDVPAVDRNKLTNSWIIQHNSKIYFGYAGHDEQYPSNVLVLDMISSKSWYYKYPVQFSCVAKDRTNGFILGGSSTGNIYRLEVPGQPTDDGTTISWELESKDFTLQTRAHFPRWVKYDVDAKDADSATGKVILNGTVHQTHTLSDRSTKRRLVETGNGERESLRITGGGKVKIYGIEAE